MRCFFWGKERELETQTFKFVCIGLTLNPCPVRVGALVFCCTLTRLPKINLNICAAIVIDPLID